MCGCLACDLGNSFTAAAPGLLLLLDEETVDDGGCECPQPPLTHLVRWSLSKAFVIQPKLDLYLHALFKLQSKSMIHTSSYCFLT